MLTALITITGITRTRGTACTQAAAASAWMKQYDLDPCRRTQVHAVAFQPTGLTVDNWQAVLATFIACWCWLSLVVI